MLSYRAMSINLHSFDIRDYTLDQIYERLQVTPGIEPAQLERTIIQRIDASTSREQAKFYMDIYEMLFSTDDPDPPEVSAMETPPNDSDVNKEMDETLRPEYQSYLQQRFLTQSQKAEVTDAMPDRQVMYKLKPNPAIQQYYASKIPTDAMVLRANNPILGETVTYQLCVYSNSRTTNSTNSTASNFTIQLTEALSDVLKISLYGLSIPNTWYTISSLYGANFMLLQGTTPGIDTGEYDYRLEIAPGNYTSGQLVAAVQTAFAAIQTTDSRVSFGDSRFIYNESTYKTTFQFDFTRRYTEYDYRLVFPDWTTPYIDLTFEENIPVKSQSLAAFLGFSMPNYSLTQIRSQFGVSSLTSADSVQYSRYTLDAQNATFRVLAYVGTEEYDASLSTLIHAVDITIPLVPGQYSRAQLAEACNAAFRASTLFLSSTEIGFATDATSGNTYYYMQVDWVPSQAVFKTVIIFPDEMYLRETGGDQMPIWTDISVDNVRIASCFQFNFFAYNPATEPHLVHELGFIIADVPLNGELIEIENAFIGFHCLRDALVDDYSLFDQSSSTVISGNDFRLDISGGVYSVSSFIEHVNAQIATFGDSVFTTNTEMQWSADTDFRVQLQLDMNQSLSSASLYTWSITETDIFSSVFDISLNNAPVNTLTKILSSPSITTPNNGVFFTIYPQGKAVTASHQPWIIELNGSTDSTSRGNDTFATYAQSVIRAFEHPDIPGVFPLSNSTVSYNRTTFELRATIVFSLDYTENDYQLVISSNLVPLFAPAGMVDVSNNEWDVSTSSFGLLNVSNYSVQNTSFARIPSAQSATDLTYNPLTTSSLVLEPISAGLVDSVVISGPNPNDNTYYRDELLEILNANFMVSTALDTHYTANSSLFGVRTIGGDEYVYFRPSLQYTYTSRDYALVLYDSELFVSESATQENTVTEDFTLGWMLGFRNGAYYMLADAWDESTNMSVLVGNATVLSNAYTNLYIVIDDFTNARVSDGLRITHPYGNVAQMPSYQTQYTLDVDATTDAPAYRTDIPLTELYANIANRTSGQSRGVISRMPTYTQDAFAILPVKRATDGQNFVDTGGTLGQQNRAYIGPVIIRKLHVRLIDERGLDLDLNGGEWSFILTVERLYTREHPDLVR